MDIPELAIFKADFTAQLQLIEQVFFMLEQRSEGLTPEVPERMESVAYQLHNFYGAIEDLLKTVAAYFENHITDTSRWHSELLRRMTQPVDGVRPSVISMESYQLLNALRAFRHFFRHAYGVPIEFTQLQVNVHRAKQLKPLLDQDFQRFLQLLTAP